MQNKPQKILQAINSWHKMASENKNVRANLLFKKCDKMLSQVSLEDKEIIYSNSDLNDWQKFWIARDLFIITRKESYLNDLNILANSKDLVTRVDSHNFVNSL